MTFAAAGQETAQAFMELGGALLVLAFAARLATWLELSPIAFYLLGGLVLGVLSPARLTEDFVEVSAGIGVVLLLFLLGLEYSADELRTNLRSQAPAGLLDAALNFTPGFLAGLLLGWSVPAAMVLGGVTWISSSGIAAKALADLGRLGNRETPVVLSLLVIEDLAMVAYLPLIAALLVGSGALAAVESFAIAAAAAAITLLIALRFGDRVGRLVEHRSQEVVMLTALGLVLLIAGVAERLQVSAAVGAFLVGIAFSGEIANRTRDLLMPLRDLAAALFFLFFALQIDTGELPSVIGVAALLAAVTAATKLVTGWWAARAAGIGAAGRARAGAALVARGEFSIVIAGLAVAAGTEERLGSLAAAYVLLLALGGPLLMKYADVLAPVLARLDRRPLATAPADGVRSPGT